AETGEHTRLYRNPLNSIHLSVPEKESTPLSELISAWKLKKIIEQDYLPGIYVYYQYFTLPASEKIHCQKGFICNIRLHEWEENQILKHEAVIPSSVNNRIEILENSEMNISPTHGLYSDPEHSLEKYMDESMIMPQYELKDTNGVINKLAIIHDKKVIEKFIAVLKNKPVILADGHHRFNASMIYKKQKTKERGSTGTEAWNFHCMYLSNTEANEVKILATHRIIGPIENFDQKSFLKKLSEYFEVKKINDINLINDEISGRQWTYGLILKNEQYILKLKTGLASTIHWNFPKEIKELDLTVLHYFIVGKGLNIKEKDQKNSKNINFSHNFTKCIDAVKEGKAQIALITREISIEEVKKVCYSGKTFPQKSTYFYPKVICGLVFSSVKNEDFITEIDSCIKLKQV
ncbi:MAG TPA: DUF1015 domain-containing protein, partial [Cytophagaceae bacterium]|nr:DUF1015 domain-containing protein [Cytophagaceae bacterium]